MVFWAQPLLAQDAAPHPGPPAPQQYVIAALGDSLGDGLWEGVYRALRADKRITVLRGARNSVGFTGSDLNAQIDPLLRRGAVHAITIMIGANDDRHSFFVNNRPIAVFGTKEWIALYRARIEKFMDDLARTKAPVVWLLLPVMRSPESTRSARLINDVIVEAARGRAHVLVVPTWPATADANGDYTAFFNDLGGRKRLMRQPDGVHFTGSGYEVLAHLAVAKLLEVSGDLRALVPPGAAQHAMTP